MFNRVALVALGILAASWWTGFDIFEAKDNFVEAIQNTGARLAGGQGDDWNS